MTRLTHFFTASLTALALAAPSAGASQPGDVPLGDGAQRVAQGYPSYPIDPSPAPSGFGQSAPGSYGSWGPNGSMNSDPYVSFGGYGGNNYGSGAMGPGRYPNNFYGNGNGQWPRRHHSCHYGNCSPYGAGGYSNGGYGGGSNSPWANPGYSVGTSPSYGAPAYGNPYSGSGNQFMSPTYGPAYQSQNGSYNPTTNLQSPPLPPYSGSSVGTPGFGTGVPLTNPNSNGFGPQSVPFNPQPNPYGPAIPGYGQPGSGFQQSVPSYQPQSSPFYP